MLPGFHGVVRATFEFAALLRARQPQLAAHFVKLDIAPAMIESFTNMFQTLFASTLAFDVTVRVWDVIFLFGWPFAHSVAMALFTLNKDMLLCEHSTDRVLALVSTLGETVKRPEQLIATALTNRVTSRELSNIGKKFDAIKNVSFDDCSFLT